jgi:cyclic pyranopterin phosphate synthase
MEGNFSYDKPLPEEKREDRKSTEKHATGGEAIAVGHVVMNEAAFQAFRTGSSTGMSEAWTIARLAGIMGAKQADELVLVSNTFTISGIEMSFETDEDSRKVTVKCEVRTRERSGAATAALVGCGLALLVLVDSLRAIDREMTIEGLQIQRNNR